MTLSLATAHLGAIDLLTAEEECDLARRRDRGDRDAWRELVRRNLPLAVRFAALACRRRGTLEDAAQDGTLGLMRAADRFDPEAGFRFSTYASDFIRAAIQRARVNAGGPIRVSAHAHIALAALDRGDPVPPGYPSDPGLLADARRALATVRATDLGDDLAPFRDRATRRDDRTADRLDVRLALRVLPPREREVIRLRFAEGLTFREVGRRMGFTKERARQLESAALSRLRAALGGEVTR